MTHCQTDMPFESTAQYPHPNHGIQLANGLQNSATGAKDRSAPGRSSTANPPGQPHPPLSVGLSCMRHRSLLLSAPQPTQIPRLATQRRAREGACHETSSRPTCRPPRALHRRGARARARSRPVPRALGIMRIDKAPAAVANSGGCVVCARGAIIMPLDARTTLPARPARRARGRERG